MILTFFDLMLENQYMMYLCDNHRHLSLMSANQVYDFLKYEERATTQPFEVLSKPNHH